jgi:O-antigen ligase
MVQTHPWFGVGVNNYAEVMADYVPFFLTQERWIVHNRYLLVASETGLVGLAVFLWTVVAVLRVVWQARRTQSPFLSGFALSLFFSLLIFFLQMAVESLDGRISDSHLWLIAGIGAALAGQAKRHPLPHPPIGRGSA